MARVAAPARRAHHPPGHADLRHARARLLARCSSPRRSTPRTRTAPRRSSTSTPASRTTTCATTTSTCGSRSPPSPTRSSGSRARSRCSRSEAGAESIRQLPTLKLFKIRMDLEMEGDTEALASAAEATEPVELDPQPYDDFDIAVIRALQGDMPVDRRALRARGRRAGHDPASACSTTSRGCRSAACCAASRRSSTTAAPASRPTAWACGRCPTSRSSRSAARMAAVRGISHCYQRPTYADWPYSVFTMAHGRSKEECDAILDAIAETDGHRTSARRSTPRPSSRRSACCTSRTSSRSGSGEHA